MGTMLSDLTCISCGDNACKAALSGEMRLCIGVIGLEQGIMLFGESHSYRNDKSQHNRDDSIPAYFQRLAYISLLAQIEYLCKCHMSAFEIFLSGSVFTYVIGDGTGKGVVYEIIDKTVGLYRKLAYIHIDNKDTGAFIFK